MNTKKTPEQIVAELRTNPRIWMTYWSDDGSDVQIGLDGWFSLDQLRAIVAVREKELLVKKGTPK